jgi:hypothetical protein
MFGREIVLSCAQQLDEADDCYPRKARRPRLRRARVNDGQEPS